MRLGNVGDWSSVFQARTWKTAASAAALALFASTFALALVLDHPHPGILHFHVLPIAILALVLGIVAGLSAIAFSLSLMAVWAELEGVELLMIDYMSGALPLLVVVLLCQFVAARAFGHSERGETPRLMDRLRSNPATELTKREKEVLALLALGYTNKQVAEELVLSVRTVESHRARIQQKLGISGRAELVRYASGSDLLSELGTVPARPALGQIE
jgi:DNA-binding CsgD family transcriptional regulator